MRKLVLDKITGFVVKDKSKPVVIRDDRGLLFYSTESMVPRVGEFNLPAGTYFVDTGYFTERKAPVLYPLAPMPEPERKTKKPFNFTVQFGNNPHKCSILWDEDRIFFDNSFKEMPLPNVFFVLYHEFGHSKYNTERYADLYASNLMKLKGYNPSQIGDAHLTSLSAAQYDRKKFVIKQLINSAQ